MANRNRQSPAQAPGRRADEFSPLLKQEFKPQSDAAKEAVETAVRTLAEQALATPASGLRRRDRRSRR